MPRRSSEEAAAESRKKNIAYKNEFNRQRYDRVSVMAPSGSREEWRKAGETKGMSLNAFIINSVETEITRMNEKENVTMKLRKYWMNEEIFIYAVEDDDQHQKYPTAVCYYVGRKFYGTLVYAFGLDERVENEQEWLEDQFYDGRFSEEVETLMNMV